MASDGTGADDGALRQTGIRVFIIQRVAAVAQDERIAHILTRQGAGEHDAGRQRGFQILEAVHGQIDAPIGQGLVNLLGEQPLAADFGQPPVLHRIARGADDMLLEHVHLVQYRADAGEGGEEAARLLQGERGGAGADAQRQLRMMPGR
jgi:hypothetical protein